MFDNGDLIQVKGPNSDMLEMYGIYENDVGLVISDYNYPHDPSVLDVLINGVIIDIVPDFFVLIQEGTYDFD